MKYCKECGQKTEWMISLQYEKEGHNFAPDDKERFLKVIDRILKEWK